MKIEKTAQGTYHARIQIGGKRYSITKATKAEVRDTIATLLTDNAPVVASDLTVEQAVRTYIDDKDGVLSPSTITAYRRYAASRFAVLMPRKIGKLTAADYQRAIQREAKTCSPKYLRNCWALIASALSYAGVEPPTVNLPQAVPTEHAFLEPEQIPLFLAAIYGHRVEIAALLALHGLRRSELLALTWQQVHEDSIEVSGAVVLDGDHYVRKRTNKNRTSTRTVPIMIPRLKELFVLADKSKPIISYNPSSILKPVNAACRRAGLPEVGVHGLRHSAVSLAYSLGMNEMAAMRLFGYSDFQTMRKIYTHLAKRDLDKCVENMAKFFENGK